MVGIRSCRTLQISAPSSFGRRHYREGTMTDELRATALRYHQRLPERLRQYLNARGIPDRLIHSHLLGWAGQRITIPIPDRDGRIAFFKLRKDPEDKTDAPKMFATLGSQAELYGWERVLAKPSEIVICEGEFDRLVLEANGFVATTSTGGAGTFREEWAPYFQEIPNVYICFDRDDAGRAGAERVAKLIPHARVVNLPEELGEGGDVTEFFGRLRRTPEAFRELLVAAGPLPPKNPPRTAGRASRNENLVADVAIERIVGYYVQLRPSGRRSVARCPFHEDHTPSFTVYPETQSFYCFGCRAHGDVFTFLQRMEHLTFKEAVKVAREFPNVQ
jgi:DNA primase